MKKIITILLGIMILVGCASQQPNCGSKAQKRAQYNKMKSGKAPGGNMLR